MKLDSNFIYDAGARLVIYLDDKKEYSRIVLTSADIEKAASVGYSGNFDIPKEYKTKVPTEYQ